MFPGFSVADFDAYAQKKWKSNVFTRERLEVKQKLLALGRELAGTMIAADGSPLACEASAEYPALWNHKQVEAQHLFFSRNEGARKELDHIIDRQTSVKSMIDDPTPLKNHVFLAATVTVEGLDLSVKLHPEAKVDRQNLERKSEDHFEAEKLTHQVRDLGAGYKVGVTPEATPVEGFDVERLRGTLAQLQAASAPVPPGMPHRMLYVGRLVPRDEVLAAGAAGTVELVKMGLARLLPLYRYIAWSRENDFVSMREALQKEKQAKRQKGITKNDTVRIVRGMFAGKSGVVQEVDAKGGLRILVGKMAVKVDAGDVDKN